MCGITGYINLNNKPIKNTSVILNMLKVQKHRGPDDSGIRAFSLRTGLSSELGINESGPVAGNFEGMLGFNRLSILDLSVNGHQPMTSPDGKVLLTLNGEIYNAFDYKHELEEWGYRFKSTSDTEIVLALYLRYGFEGMLSRLNGMFAIVVIDLSRNKFFIARDRFGIKPMYYIANGEMFAFSSELKSFGFLEGFQFSLNHEQIDEYLLFRNNLGGTLFRDIESLTPAHYLTLSPEAGLSLTKYFDINDYKRRNDSETGLDEYGERLEEWLSRSVQSQLMSDVKLGCQLSGGIDSSLVTWLANRNSSKGNFEAVSIIFKDQRFSEEKYIDIVTEKLGIPSHKFLLDDDYYFDNFIKASWHLESPVNHPNTIGIYKLSQRAKEYVTVLLSGEGADEVFGGYGRFYDIEFPFRPRKIFSELRKNFRNPGLLPEYLSPSYRAVMATAFMNPFLSLKLKEAFNFEKATIPRRDLFNSLSGSLFDRQVKYEIKTYLPDLLIRQDKMSMAHSIENRVPFLDNDVVENSFTIPERKLLIRKSAEGANTQKYLLKKVTAKEFGTDFAFRDKMGFGIPVREFFMNKRFNEYIKDNVLQRLKRENLFNYQVVEDWVTNIGALKHTELEALWIVISFDIWKSQYIDSFYENRHT